MCGVRERLCLLRRGPCGCPSGEKVDHCVPQPPLLAVNGCILLLGSIEIVNLLVAFLVRRVARQVACEGSLCLSGRGAQLALQTQQADERDEKTSNRNTQTLNCKYNKPNERGEKGEQLKQGIHETMKSVNKGLVTWSKTLNP